MTARTLLSQTTIAGNGTTTGDSVRIGNAKSLTVESVFLYGAGGGTCKVYVQTTLDGTVWIDVAQHAFTTAAATKVSAVTCYIAPAAQALTPGDAALTDNTIIQGVLGDSVRVKVVSAGTVYSGATSIAVHAVYKT